MEWVREKKDKIPADINVEETQENIYVKKLSILEKCPKLFDCRSS